MAVGTDDLYTLSTIYSQLANAYFFVGDLSKSLEYHRFDFSLARAIGDRRGEAKASGNIGNVLKNLNRFEEAVVCCERQRVICEELDEKVSVLKVDTHCDSRRISTGPTTA